MTPLEQPHWFDDFAVTLGNYNNRHPIAGLVLVILLNLGGLAGLWLLPHGIVEWATGSDGWGAVAGFAWTAAVIWLAIWAYKRHRI